MLIVWWRLTSRPCFLPDLRLARIPSRTRSARPGIVDGLELRREGVTATPLGW
jgi:hypothetical protein